MTDTREALAARQLWETIKILGLSNEKLALEAIRAALATQPVAQPSAQGEAVAHKELEGWKTEAESLRQDRDYWRQRAQMMYEHQQRECWYWQGDGEDHLESLVGSLPVVILARDLRAMLASAPAAPAQAVPLTGRDIESALNFAPIDLPYLERCRWIAQRLNERGIAPKAAQP